MTDRASAAGEHAPPVLIVPGLGNSGPGHWQTLWEQERTDCVRVDLGMWDQPHRNTWVNQLNLSIRAAGQPVVLVAHSLGCLAVAWWAQLEQAHAGQLVRGALLVAPPEVDDNPLDPRIATFAPTPSQTLPFPAILVGSRNDPYMNLRAVRRLAKTWGCRFADAGQAGHINADSGLGDWSFGQFLLDQLLRRAPGETTKEPTSGNTGVGLALAAGIGSKWPDLAEGQRILGFNCDNRERYLSGPDFLPEA